MIKYIVMNGISIMSAAIFLLFLTPVFSDDYAKLNMFLGYGIKSEKQRCSGECYQYDDAVMLEVTWKPSKNTAVKALHISDIFMSRDGHGTNDVFVGLDVDF